MSVRNYNNALTLLLNLSAATGKISALLQQVQVEGRTGPSDAELAALGLSDDLQRAALVAAIEGAKTGS